MVVATRAYVMPAAAAPLTGTVIRLVSVCSVPVPTGTVMATVHLHLPAPCRASHPPALHTPHTTCQLPRPPALLTPHASQAAQHTHLRLASCDHGHYGDCTALSHVLWAEEGGPLSQLPSSTGSTAQYGSCCHSHSFSHPQVKEVTPAPTSAGGCVASGNLPATTATPWRLVSDHWEWGSSCVGRVQ